MKKVLVKKNAPIFINEKGQGLAGFPNPTLKQILSKPIEVESNPNKYGLYKFKPSYIVDTAFGKKTTNPTLYIRSSDIQVDFSINKITESPVKIRHNRYKYNNATGTPLTCEEIEAKSTQILMIRNAIGGIGTIGGLVYANRTGKSFWGYVGYAILGGMITGVIGTIVTLPTANKIVMAKAELKDKPV